MFKFELINRKKILISDILSKDKLIHLFTTRDTVLTPKDIDSLKEAAAQNLLELSDFLSIKPENIIIPEQTHSDNIALAEKGKLYPNTDALIVKDTDIAILLNFADCTPVILYDERLNIGAIAHAGWKGTAKRIAPKTVLKMKDLFNTAPKNVTAIIGPAISMKNYKVDTPVFEAIKSSMKNDYNDWYRFNKQEGKYNIDLKTVNKHQLEELGILRIDKCDYCTYDSVDVFFSYRKEQGNTARHSAVLKLIK